mmetsp:Transcript_75518/g.179384  ORF Transcript_75518/g.179384 Transcript_75518/m.179384 type:complete len:489 (-) Transcript_75518:154-1620(-)
MLEIRTGSAVGNGSEVFLGRAPSATKSQPLECPSSVSCDGYTARATGKSGKYRNGKLTDVKPDMHWLLEPTAKGYVLRPVVGWYEFGIEEAASSSSASRKRPLPDGEGELKKGAAQRKADEERWSTMLERRPQQPKTVRQQMYTGAQGDDKMDSYDEEDRLNDDLGLKREKKKQLKALKKGAGDQVDEEDVPDSANALLNLKSEKAEGVWDFEEKDEFSDDDLEQDDFNDELQGQDQDEQAPSADEDDADAPDAEEGLLTQHGKELEVLMSQYGEGDGEDAAEAAEGSEEEQEEDGQAEGLPEEHRQPPPPEASVSSAASARSNASGGKGAASGLSAPPSAASASSGPSRLAGKLSVPKTAPPPAAKAAAAKGVPAAKKEAVRTTAAGKPAQSKPAAAQAAGAQSSSAPASEAAAPSSTDLRSKVVKCLLDRGGSCKLADVVAALGLKDKKSALYANAVAILKEVASVEQVPGEKKTAILRLRPEYQR